VSIRRAIGSYGIGAGFGRGWLDRLLEQVRYLPRPMVLSLRNTFRRKARVALTLITLVLGGAMFIVVMSVDTSFNTSVEVLMQSFGHDVMIQLDRDYRSAWLVSITQSVPQVTRVEVWDYQGARLSLASGGERELQLWGMPSDSEMFSPDVVSGRGLLPDDGRAILLDNTIAVEEGIGVGDEVELAIGGRESAWTVVGLVLSISSLTEDCYVPFDAATREVGIVNRGNQVFVQAERHDEESHQVLTRDLRNAYAARNVGINVMQSVSENREQNRNTFRAVTYLLLTMAILAAMVGGIGLMGTMSINVVERGREIGVMRAIGATSVAISGIFVGEGVFLGVLSWLIAVPLSYPGARIFSNMVGLALLKRPLHFSYSVGAVQLWLVIVVLLSAVASVWPALRATKVSVRQALAYE
jgi:putative ABC transport system permease protein